MLGSSVVTTSLYEHPELYDELLPVDPACIAFYGGLGRKHRGEVLELACGSGQLTVPVAGLGCSIAGIDNAPAMLDAARDRASGAGVPVSFSLADMRHFDLDRTFSLIFVARNSLLHLTKAEELAMCLESVRQHLTDDGRFAFDVFNPDLKLLSRPSGERFMTMRIRSKRLGEIVVEETSDYDAAAQVNRITWFVRSGGTELGAFPLHLRSIFPQELRLLLRNCSFDLEDVFGDYDRTPFSSGSRRQVAVCRPR